MEKWQKYSFIAWQKTRSFLGSITISEYITSSWILLSLIILLLTSRLIGLVLEEFIFTPPHSIIMEKHDKMNTIKYNTFNAISQNNVFNVLVKRATQKDFNNLQTRENLTNLLSKYTLVGAAVGLHNSLIILKGSEGMGVFGIGDKIFDTKITLSKVVDLETKKQATFSLASQTGTLDLLTVDVKKLLSNAKKEDEAVEIKGDDFYVSSQFVQEQLAHVDQLVQQANAVPYMQNGKQVGFLIQYMQPNSIFTKFGLKQGDILSSVNGEALDSIQKAMSLYNKLQTSHEIELNIVRDKKKKSLSLHIQ